MDSPNLVDYVVVCGSPTNPDQCTILPKRSISRYVVDIAVIFPAHEEIPHGYERVRLSPSGREIDLNTGKFWRTKCWIAVKYGWGDSSVCELPPENTPWTELPISSVKVYQGSKDAKVSDGWTTIKTSPSGRDANLNVGSGSSNEIYLAIKRIDTKNAKSSSFNTNVLTQITVIDCYYDEKCPMDYIQSPLNLNLNSSGHEMYMCTKILPYISQSHRIVPSLLERFPRKDKKKSTITLPAFN